MIPKKKEDYNFVEGDGRHSELKVRELIEKTTTERQTPVLIDLSALNGQDGNPRAPKNFHKKAGRVMATRTELLDESEDGFDIE